jgi:protein archease
LRATLDRRRHGGPCRFTLPIAALLAAWLEELVFLAESEGFVATRVVSLELDDESGLQATVAGVIDDPSPIVKAVTYHRLTFEARRDGYTASVVLDV